MTLALIVALSQLADGLAYLLAHGRGTELNPAASTLIDAFGPPAMLAFKTGAALVLGLGSLALLRRHRGRQMVAWLAVIGFFGCLTELHALI